MQHEQMRLRLEPWSESTRLGLRLYGSLPMTLPLSEARHLITWLAGWSGRPVECALFADKGTVGWCGWWTAHLADMPELRLRVRYKRDTERGAAR